MRVCVFVCVCGGRDMKVGREDYHTLGAFTAAEATWGVCYHGCVSCSHYHRHVLPSACIQEEQDVHSLLVCVPPLHSPAACLGHD